MFSEVQLEEAIDRTMHQFNSVDVPLVNLIDEGSLTIIDSSLVIKPKQILIVDD
jgi:hypothetical protein